MFKKLFKRRENRQEHLAIATRELEQFLLSLRGMSDAEVGHLVAMAAVVRMSLRPVGALPDEAFGIGMPLSESAEIEVRRNLVQTVFAMQKKNHAMTAGAMVWVHTLRSYHFPELRLYGGHMWGELQRGFPQALSALTFIESVTNEPTPLATAQATQFNPIGLEPMPTKSWGQELVDNLNRNVLNDVPTS